MARAGAVAAALTTAIVVSGVPVTPTKAGEIYSYGQTYYVVPTPTPYPGHVYSFYYYSRPNYLEPPPQAYWRPQPRFQVLRDQFGRIQGQVLPTGPHDFVRTDRYGNVRSFAQGLPDGSYLLRDPAGWPKGAAVPDASGDFTIYDRHGRPHGTVERDFWGRRILRDEQGRFQGTMSPD